MSLQMFARAGLTKTSFVHDGLTDAQPALRSPFVQKLLQTPKPPPPETVVVIDAPAANWTATPTWGGATAGRQRVVESVMMIGLFGYFAVGGLMTLLR